MVEASSMCTHTTAGVSTSILVFVHCLLLCSSCFVDTTREHTKDLRVPHWLAGRRDECVLATELRQHC